MGTMNNIKLLAVAGASLVAIATILTGFYVTQNRADDFLPNIIGQDNTLVVFKTSKGNIVLELYNSQTPITAGNFVRLAESGFYNGTKFHRVIPGFMIQGGDPNSKGDDVSTYGLGGPGFTIKDEFVEGLSNVRGTISMANTGRPNSGGSQFFINLVDNTQLDFDKEPLTSKHPVFGRVIAGMDVVDEIATVETDSRDVPTEPIVIIEQIIANPN